MDRIRILIADDEPEILESLVAVLDTDPTIEVVGKALDADGAIELAARTRPDIALVDVRMPGGGGPRTAREITNRSATRVVALSAVEDRQTVLSMIRAGASGYLGKDAAAGDILRAIHRTVGGGTELGPGVINEMFQMIAESVEATGWDVEARQRLLRIIERGAIDFAFQPIVELASMRVVGAEGLARFRTHPRRPTPLWFAEAAAEGLLRELELAAITAALPSLARLPGDMFLALNVTPATAGTAELRELLTVAPSRRIVIEIVDYELADDFELLSEGLDELRDLGVRVAIDDVGREPDGVRFFLTHEPDFVKLHPSLTQDLSRDRDHQAWVAALLILAEDIGAGVVAKGVESGRELAAVRDLGVPYAQGYHLARPSRIPEGARPWGRATFTARPLGGDAA